MGEPKERQDQQQGGILPERNEVVTKSTSDEAERRATAAFLDQLSTDILSGRGNPTASGDNASGTFQANGDSGLHFTPLSELERLNDTQGSGAVDSQYSNKELAEKVAPRDANSPFNAAQDLSALTSAGNEVPAGRRRSGFYNNNENYWESHTHSMISKGDIDENTLVVANTGHGPTIAAVMAERLGSDTFFHAPASGLDPIGLKRTRDQFQTYADRIADGQANGRKGSSTLLSFDAHQTTPHTAEMVAKLPNAEQLRSMGITKVFYANEGQVTGTRPFQPYPATEPVQAWLAQLQKDGIQVVMDGFDTRPRNRS